MLRPGSSLHNCAVNQASSQDPNGFQIICQMLKNIVEALHPTKPTIQSSAHDHATGFGVPETWEAGMGVCQATENHPEGLETEAHLQYVGELAPGELFEPTSKDVSNHLRRYPALYLARRQDLEIDPPRIQTRFSLGRASWTRCARAKQ